MPSGVRSRRPAAAASARTAPATPVPQAWSEPNIDPTHAGMKIASGSWAATASRIGPPPGSSFESVGTTSVPTTARATPSAPRTRGAGTWSTTVMPAEAIRSTPAQCSAATFQPASSAPDWRSLRRSRIRSPVLICTGQAVEHIPSTAQVCTTS